MPKPSPGYVRNMIRRSFREAIDPGPNKKAVDAVWKHFRKRCAFCDMRLRRLLKQGTWTT